MLTPIRPLMRLALAAALVLPLCARAEVPVISGMAVESRDNDGEFVSFLTNQPLTPIHYFTLPNPDRIAIDVPRTSGAGVRLPSDYQGRLLKSVRFGQFNKDMSRIVLDLNYPVTIKGMTPGAPFGIDIVPQKPLSELTANVKQSVQVVEKESLTPAKMELKRAGAQSKAAGKSHPVSNPVQQAEPVKEKPLIAVDAGHGGQDPGALGVHDTHEKDVTLNFARHLAEALVKTGRYRAKLIRDDDHFVMLGDRVNIARKAHADLFISFHADSNPNPEARGLSIYTLSATASDATAAALAERENKSDIITGLDLNTTDQDVANILIDLTQRETMNKSLTLADDIVSSMGGRINKLEGTHRFAGFRVLKAPDVPSVLIELGFLTNPTDERMLLSPDYRDLVVNSVIKGVDHYYAAQ